MEGDRLEPRHHRLGGARQRYRCLRYSAATDQTCHEPPLAPDMREAPSGCCVDMSTTQRTLRDKGFLDGTPADAEAKLAQVNDWSPASTPRT